MRHWDCPYDDTDEDCYKCAIHGHIPDCDGCEDYEQLFQKKSKGDTK